MSATQEPGPCLVTGATGLMGSHLVPSLAKTRDVFALSRRPRAASGRARSIALDLASEASLDALPPRIDSVVHLAQSEHFRAFPELAEHLFRVNALGTVRLLDYARRAGARTFVLASSGGVYGSGEKPFTEEAPISRRGDLGFYVTTKLCAELASTSYADCMSVIVLRFFFVYGPGQNETMLIPRLVRNVREGTPLTLQGEDGIRMNPTHVSDAVNAIEHALSLGKSATVNVAGPEILSIRQIGGAIGRALGKEPRFAVDTKATARDLIGSVEHMTALLGAPVTRFEEGIARLVGER